MVHPVPHHKAEDCNTAVLVKSVGVEGRTDSWKTSSMKERRFFDCFQDKEFSL